MPMRRSAHALLAVVVFVMASLPAAAHYHTCLRDDGTSLDRGGHGAPGATGATGSCGQDEREIVDFSLGWDSEPPFTGVKNGLSVSIRQIVRGVAPAEAGHAHGAGNATPSRVPVEGVTGLAATVEFGGQTFPARLEAAFGEPGKYGFDIAPTRAGTYVLHVVGNLTLNMSGTLRTFPIDFRSNVAAVQPIADIQFPDKGTSTGAGLVRGSPGFEGLTLLASLGLVALVARRCR
jgi:hypothetical protein